MGRVTGRQICGLVAALAMAAAGPSPAASQTLGPVFNLGFKVLADQLPDITGSPLENEHYGANGDSLQQTTTGLMVWRKADNWTAFTNGSRTWINGPFGLQSRANADRFEWERDPSPPVEQAPSPVNNPPSQYDIAGKERLEQMPDGTQRFLDIVANVNHYWTAVDIQVVVTLRDAEGRSVLEGRATSDTLALGPQQSSTWEFAIPSGVKWQSLDANVTFVWRPPGAR